MIRKSGGGYFKSRRKLGLEGCYAVIGVATPWNIRKGYSDFINMAKALNECKVIMVGLSEEQMNDLPDNVIGFKRTDSTQELAELYGCADVFVNTTYQDNYPTTNIEALACGIPIVTYNTGGSIESASKGCIVEQGDIFSIINIIQMKEAKKISCNVSREKMVEGYLELYSEFME